MKTERLYELSATQAIAAVRSGEITATALTKSCIERVKKLEPKIHAWAFFDEKIALQQAEKIDRQIEAGTFKGRLFGVPVGIKDIYNTIDMPTEMGSPVWKGFMPGNDARSVFYIREEGGVLFGKTVTAEFAVHYPGPTVNPHNPTHTPGTSSSGSAAAVAASMVPVSTGSQTAGSTIRPASYCGIYGFKPTFGMIPRTGVLKTVDVLDHVTIFARTIEDVELFFDIMRVKGHNFPFINSQLENDSKQKTKGPWKVAFVKTHLWDGWEEYAKKNVLRLVGELSKCNDMIVEETVLPDEFKEAHDIHHVIYNKALSYYYKDEYNNNKEKLSAIFREMLEDGMKITKEQYLTALDKQNRLSHLLDKFFEKYDCIITLSTAGEAKKGLHSTDTPDSCLIWTLCGAPAINIPVFKGPNGLPFGAQAVFRKYHDRSMFNFLRLLKEIQLIKDVSYEIN